MKSIDITILTPGFPSDEQDLNCIPSLQLLIKEMIAIPGVRLQVITTQYPFRFGTYQWNGIPVHACGGANRRYFWKVITYLKAIYFLVSKSRRSEVIQGFWLHECAVLAALWGKLTGALQVVTVQGQDSKPGNGYFRIMRWLIPRTRTKIVSISEFGAKQLLKNGGIQTDAILPTGIDASSIPEASGSSARSWDVVGAGSLIPVKNFQQFIEVIALVRKKFPSIRSCIAGGGPEMNVLKARISALGLNNHVVLLGEIPRNEVLSTMKNGKIFLHTSLWEGQGFVLMESLAMGMYTVAGPVGFLPPSPKSFICQGNEEMAEAIANILSGQQEFEPVPLLTMEDTARNYLHFYFDHLH